MGKIKDSINEEFFLDKVAKKKKRKKKDESDVVLFLNPYHEARIKAFWPIFIGATTTNVVSGDPNPCITCKLYTWNHHEGGKSSWHPESLYRKPKYPTWERNKKVSASSPRYGRWRKCIKDDSRRKKVSLTIQKRKERENLNNFWRNIYIFRWKRILVSTG